MIRDGGVIKDPRVEYYWIRSADTRTGKECSMFAGCVHGSDGAVILDTVQAAKALVPAVTIG